jgi:hypothetical protein
LDCRNLETKISLDRTHHCFHIEYHFVGIEHSVQSAAVVFQFCMQFPEKNHLKKVRQILWETYFLIHPMQQQGSWDHLSSIGTTVSYPQARDVGGENNRLRTLENWWTSTNHFKCCLMPI